MKMKNNNRAALFGIRIRTPREWGTYVYQNREYMDTFVYENVYQCIPTYTIPYLLVKELINGTHLGKRDCGTNKTSCLDICLSYDLLEGCNRRR